MIKIIFILLSISNAHARDICIERVSMRNMCDRSLTLKKELSVRDTEYCLSNKAFFIRSDEELERQKRYLDDKYLKLEKIEQDIHLFYYDGHIIDEFYRDVLLYNKEVSWINNISNELAKKKLEYNKDLCNGSVANKSADPDRIHHMTTALYTKLWSE
jgi:hypothetical protein